MGPGVLMRAASALRAMVVTACSERPIVAAPHRGAEQGSAQEQAAGPTATSRLWRDAVDDSPGPLQQDVQIGLPNELERLLPSHPLEASRLFLRACFVRAVGLEDKTQIRVLMSRLIASGGNRHDDDLDKVLLVHGPSTRRHAGNAAAARLRGSGLVGGVAPLLTAVPHRSQVGQPGLFGCLSQRHGERIVLTGVAVTSDLHVTVMPLMPPQQDAPGGDVHDNR